MEFVTATPFLDIIVLLALMFIFARHEADWEFTTALSAYYFGFLNPKAVLVFWPQCIACRLFTAFEVVPWLLALLLFFLPMAPATLLAFLYPVEKINSNCGVYARLHDAHNNRDTPSLKRGRRTVR